MTVQCRTSANSLLRTAKEALKRPCRCEAGAIPERALPRSGTFGRHSIRHGGTSARGSHAGFGAWAASAEANTALGEPGHAAHQCTKPTRYTGGRRVLPRYSAIAICSADVLNSPRALTAFRTGKLTRNERAAEHGRNYAETRWCIQRYRQRVATRRISGNGTQRRPRCNQGRKVSPFTGGGRGSYRAKLRGSAFTGITALP
jgi:hypothetical protein